jgi:RNase P subunit RPR2
MKTIVNNDVIKVACSGCHSLLAVEKQDIKVEEISHHRPAQWVGCRECGAIIAIPLSEIPPHWRAGLFADFD